jgi:hypothetical protein
VHVVSDLRHELVEARTSVQVAWSAGQEQLGWAGTVPADECERVGTVRLTVPAAPGPLTFDLSVEAAGEVVATNRYETTVT